jgi:hypothetical protein
MLAMLRVINRAYWLIRCMIPLVCMCYFVFYVRYVTEVKIRFLRLAVRAAGSNEQFGVVWKCLGWNRMGGTVCHRMTFRPHQSSLCCGHRTYGVPEVFHAG